MKCDRNFAGELTVGLNWLNGDRNMCSLRDSFVSWQMGHNEWETDLNIIESKIKELAVSGLLEFP